MAPSLLHLVEQAYRLDLDDASWYSDLARSAAELVPESDGAMAYSFDATQPREGVRIAAWGSCNVPDSFVEGTLALNRSTTPDDAARFYHRGVLCGTVSEALRLDGHSIEENETYESTVAQRGFSDTFGLTASSPTWHGTVINAPLGSPTALNARTRLAWSEAGVHLQAAHRLREALERKAVAAEAVIAADNRVVHAEGEATPKTARDRLRSAARAVDRLRSRGGAEEPDEALAMWEGLVNGRWTLVETFESDGRRYFVAYPNELELPAPRALSAREVAVVGYVVQGDPNKWIAYQLGVSAATVARHLSNALGKLGLTHRHELIWLYHSIRREGH